MNLEEDVDPKTRGILDSIISAVASVISRPVVLEPGTTGQGNNSPLLSSIVNGIANTGGSLLNSLFGTQHQMDPVDNTQPIQLEQDEELLDVLSALSDYISLEQPNVATDVSENDMLSNVDDVDEVPLYLVVF